MIFSFELNPKPAPQLGLIVLQADETIERDMRLLLPPTVEFLVSRVPSGTHVTPESLTAMEAELQRAASLFPHHAKLSVVGYGCTSGAAQIGADRVASAVQSGVRTEKVTEPVSALIAACRHLDVTRLGLLSPYIASVSDRLKDVLGGAGIDVCAFGSFNESKEESVARISADSIRTAAAELSDSASVDAIFISCTNLRALEVIADIEAQAAVPVLTSNQVLAWHMIGLAGIKHPGTHTGALWNKPSA